MEAGYGRPSARLAAVGVNLGVAGELIRSLDGFAALEPLWSDLSAAGGVHTPYQSFAWLEQWLRHRADAVQPFVLVLQQGQTIAPFGIVRQAGVRVLRLLGAPDSDYTGLVTTRSLDEAWGAVGQALHASIPMFDLVHLHSVRERDVIVAALGRHLGGLGRTRSYETCPWISTSRSWDAFRARCGKPLRAEIKRWERRMSEAGEARVERVRPPLADGVLGEMADLERRSWKWEHGTATFRPGPYCDFMQAVLRDQRTNAEVWLLRVDGRLAAFAVVLIATNRWCYYQTSFRTDVPNAGAYLLSRIVQAACESDCETLDLLRGDHGYKRAWTNAADTVYEITWPSSFVGHAAAIAYAVRWRAARSTYLRRMRARIEGTGDRREG